jgi:hypothetical protein
VKLAVYTLALMSLTLFVLAAGEWPAPSPESDSDHPVRAGWRGGLILFAVTLLLMGTLWATAAELGWNRHRVLWVGLGAFLAVMTISRPWWFWENYKARWLRDSIGNGPTTFIYLAFSAVLVWVGLYTDRTFGRR